MRKKRPFQTTTIAEFREIVKTAQTGGRLPELIAAINKRVERHRAILAVHQSVGDYQSIQQTKKLITALENKLEIARQEQ